MEKEEKNQEKDCMICKEIICKIVQQMSIWLVKKVNLSVL